VGIYGIAAWNGRVYVSNLHVPFITVVDAEAGALRDALDLRDGCAEVSFFPKLLVAGDILWVTHGDDQVLCRYDLAEERWLDPVPVDGLGAVAVDGPDLWVSTPTTLLRHDGTAFVEEVPAPGWASALDVSEGRFALLMAPIGRVSLLTREAESWSARVGGPALNDIALLNDTVYITERSSGAVIALRDGAEQGRLVTGSDTFAVDRFDDHLLVTNRQGAELPASGAYEGAPGLVTALDADLSVRWRTELSKTIHYLAFDGTHLWAANEDALRLSAIDPNTGEERLRTDPLGLTIDHLSTAGGAWLFGSHLTDEVWRIHPEGRAEHADVCGWPFLTLPTAEGLVVPCQEDAEVWTLDPETLALLAQADLGDTLFPACALGLCTGHDALVSAAEHEGAVVVSDPHAVALRWTDGRTIDLGESVGPGDVLHFDVAPLGGTLLAFEPISRVLHAVRDGEVVASLPYPDPVAPFPLVPNDGRVWVGNIAVDAALEEVGSLPTDHVAYAAGGGWIVTLHDESLVVLDPAMTELGRVPLADLRVPPLRTLGDTPGPIRLLIQDETLVVGNTMRGTLERRSLPDLAPLGPDTPEPVGRWAALPGLR
jgi:hypothetical protein